MSAFDLTHLLALPEPMFMMLNDNLRNCEQP
jgi:hypothetical protein